MFSRIVQLVLFLVGPVIFGQTPSEISLLKLRYFDQGSDSDLQASATFFGVQAKFSNSVTNATTVQVRRPDGRLIDLVRITSTEYQLNRDLADDAALAAEFPDGVYTVIVAGNIAGGTNVFVQGIKATPPVRITNFTSLQDTHDLRPPIRWEPVAGATDSDLLRFAIVTANNSEVFSTGISFPATATGVTPTLLPPGVRLFGFLTYLKVASSAISAAGTRILIATGFEVRLPLRRVETPPTIARQSKSQVVDLGSWIRLSVEANGASSYQWRKDGVPLPGATSAELSFSPVKGSDAGTYVVEAINTAGGATGEPIYIAIAPAIVFTPFAGWAGVRSSSDGPIGAASFAAPSGIVVSPAGVLFVSDGHAIRRIANGTVTTFAGVTHQAGNVDGEGTAARLNSPGVLALDAGGNLFVSDRGNERVRKITPDGVVSTLAGFNSAPLALAADAAGNLFAGVRYSIVRRDPAGMLATVYTPPGGENAGTAVNALAFDRAGNLFVSNGEEIMRIAPDGDTTLYAGSREGFYDQYAAIGGIGTGLRFLTVNALAVDAAGNLYASSAVGDVWFIPPSRATVRAAKISPVSFQPGGHLTVDANGVVYAVNLDQSLVLSGRVVKYSEDPGISLAAAPQGQTLARGDSVAFNVEAKGPNLSYQWLKNGRVIVGANYPMLVERNVTQPAEYTVRVGNAVGVVTSPPVEVNLASGASPGRLVNLSLHAHAGTGPQTLIMGFAVGGTGNRSFLIRGAGPALTQFGVEGVLMDPRLDVADPSGTIVANNDDWTNNGAMVETSNLVGAFQLPPGSRDAALLTSLAANNAYTAKVSGANAAEGIALAEVYDASPGTGLENSRLTNISARTVVGAGGGVTVGFVIGGSTARTLLIRAIGSGLSAFGITEWLRQPDLAVYAGQTKIAQNAGWQGVRPLQDLFPTVGAFRLSLGSTDAALVATLPPGPYSVQVSGVPVLGVSSGVTLVEIYEVR